MSANIEGEEFVTYIVVHHQVAIEMFWLMSSIFICTQWFISVFTYDTYPVKQDELND